MSRRVGLVLVLAPLVCLGACAGFPGGLPAAHVGPVTATVRVDERTFSCSQAGVFEECDDGLRFLVDPGWRSFALAGRDRRQERPGLLLVGGGDPARRGMVSLLSEHGVLLGEAHIADDLIYAVALSPDTAQAVAGCADGRVLRLKTPGLAVAETGWRHGGPVVAVAYSADGALLATAGTDGRILLGKADADAPMATLVDHTAAVVCLSWSPGGLLASGSRDGKVRLHDHTGRFLQVWPRLGGEVASVDFDDGQLVYRTRPMPGEPAHTGALPLPHF